MSPQRITLWAILGLSLVAAVGYRMRVFREPPPPPTPRIAFVTGGSGPYWQLTVAGARAAAGDHQVELQIEMPSDSESIEQQMAILERLSLAELGGIALSPLDADGQTRLINGLVRRENKVVTFDSDAPLSDRQSYVGTSNVAAGITCARLVGEALPDGGKVAVLLANLTKENLLDRKSGFQEEIRKLQNTSPEAKPRRYGIVGYLLDNGSAETCAENIRQTLSEHPDLACFVGMNARHGPILLDVLKKIGKLGEIKLITFDDAEETLAGIEAGHIYATVAQDPYKYGYEAVATLASLCRGNETNLPIVGKGSTYVNAEPIRQENLREFRARLKARQKASQSMDSSTKST
jgi:ribose transport system substrate-binding protein